MGTCRRQEKGFCLKHSIGSVKMVVIEWTNDVGVVSVAICNGIGQTLQFLTPLSVHVHVHVQLLRILVLQRKEHECRMSPS